jgi:hypothetical protein
MKHFTDERWLDFARRLLPEGEERHMQAHLDEGCATCSEVYRIWQSVYQIVSRESSYEPDDTLVNTVKHKFSGRFPRPAGPDVLARLAELVFDSLWSPVTVAAGVRSMASSARHLLYRSGPLAIDVRLNMHDGSQVSIAGQVMERAGAEFADHAVQVLRGDAVLSRTTTNQFGEFHAIVDHGPGIRIRIEVDELPLILTVPDQ